MLRTHRQRVPAMMAVACVGMMVYGLAGAAPDDGRELAPAEATAPAAKDGKDSTTQTTEKCDGSTPTTRKDGDGKDSTTSTTKGDSKDGDGKDSTTSTTKGDSKDSPDSTSTTRDKTDVTTAAAVKGGSGSDTADKETTATTEKSGSGSAGKDGCDSTTSTTRDKDTTDTTDKDGKGTTSTTRKSGGKNSGKDSTTTTTDRKDRPTTSTTEKRATVEPSTPGDNGDPGSGGTDSGSSDPGATPIEPQEAPPADEPAPADAGPVDGGDYYDMPDEGPVPWNEDEVAIEPMAAPGEAAPVLPNFGAGFYDGTGSKAAAPAKRPRANGSRQQVASAPLVLSSSGVVQATPGVTESAAVSRNLPGLQTSATESAFPADIISTPKVFPVNRRDPLAAAALILLVGVGRELFKAWRRQANDYWVA